MPIRCQCIPIRCQSSANPSQSDINPKSIQRQSGSNQASTYSNLMSIWCQSSATQFRSDANPVPILCQTNSNPSQLPKPTQCQCTIHADDNTSPKYRSNVNPWPITQSHANLPISYQSANCMSTERGQCQGSSGDDKYNDKDKYKDKYRDKYKDKVQKIQDMYYIFEKQRVQGQ